MQVPGFGPGSEAWKAPVLDQTTLHLLYVEGAIHSLYKIMSQCQLELSCNSSVSVVERLPEATDTVR